MSTSSTTRQFAAAARMFLALTLLLGVLYPAVIWGIGRLGLSDQVDGSRVERGGVVVGSSLLGQNFTDERHFQSRPSASEYAGGVSGGSNLYASNEDQQKAVAERQSGYAAANGGPPRRPTRDRLGQRPRPAHLAGERDGAGAAGGLGQRSRRGCRRGPRAGAHPRPGPSASSASPGSTSSSSTSPSRRRPAGDPADQRRPLSLRGTRITAMARGKLRVYLGAAPGVGKTVDMLSEARRRKERGTDVVIGVCETHGRTYTAALMEGLEQVPLREVPHRGTVLRELDLDALLARRPEVALVDELAHTNAPGSRHTKRWEDVHELLDAGINVISTVNIQHFESLNDVVEAITGVRQQETVPDEVVREADQIELVDMSPHALRRRLAHGNVYAAEKVDAALANYFREGNLSALRELSLLWVADRVEEGLDRYRADHDITEQWPTRERVVVALTGGPEGPNPAAPRCPDRLRGAGGEMLAVYVTPPDGLVDASLEGLGELRQLTAELGGTFHTVKGDDPAEALLDFARGVNARQIVISASRRRRWQAILSPGVGQRVVDDSGDIDVHLVSHELTRTSRPRLSAGPALGRRRSAHRRLLATVGVVLLTAVLHLVRGWHDLPLDVLLFLLLTVLSALAGGIGPALVAAVLGSLALNWFFTPPRCTPSPSPTRRTSWCCSSTSWWPWPCRRPSTSATGAPRPLGRPSARLRRWRSRRRRCSRSGTSSRPCCARWSSSSPWTAPPWLGAPTCATRGWWSPRRTASRSTPSRPPRCARRSTTTTPWCSWGGSSAARTAALGSPRSLRGRRCSSTATSWRSRPAGRPPWPRTTAPAPPCSPRCPTTCALRSRASRPRSPACASTTSRSPRRTRRACSRPSRSPPTDSPGSSPTCWTCHGCRAAP